MSFRRTSNEVSQWQVFCNKHAEYIDQIPRLAPLFNSSQRFDNFLQTGIFSNKFCTFSIQSLTEEEWLQFTMVVDKFSTDWQTYFTRTMYHSYFTELDGRHWSPASPEFAISDLSLPRLVIHFWASWNAVDRTMDTTLVQLIPQFKDDIEFRSVDVDRTGFREMCVDAGILNVPALGFYQSGNHMQTLIGLRLPNDLKTIIQSWLETP